METIKVDKKVLLHTDTYELKQSKARAKEAEAALNNFVVLVGKELKRKLKPDEMEAVKNDALNFLERSLSFPLPNAPEKMRYDALGIDIWVIQQAWKKRNWERWEFAQEGNSFKLKDEQPLYDAYYKYATSKQLEVLEQTQTLADALNVATKEGLNVMRTYGGDSIAPMHKLKDLFPVVRYEEKQGEFVPDLEYLTRIK